MPTHGEVDALLSVLWHTSAIRSFYEDRALLSDQRMWENNGGLFANFSRYNSQRWKEMMGEDDVYSRGRRISRSSMAVERREFEQKYRESIMYALELAERVRSTVDEAVNKRKQEDAALFEEDIADLDEDDYWELAEEVAAKAWETVKGDPEVRRRIAKFARDWTNTDENTICL